MRQHLSFSAAFTAIVVLASNAQAAVQGLLVSGVITQVSTAERNTTTDIYGLFGPAGTDLAGQPITVFVQYVPGYFKKPYYGSGSYFHDSKFNSDQSGSLFLVVTVGSVQHAFAPASTGKTSVGEVQIASAGTTFAVQNYSGPSAAILYGVTTPTTFGMPLDPKTLIGTPTYTSFQYGNVGSEAEYLTFQISSASN